MFRYRRVSPPSWTTLQRDGDYDAAADVFRAATQSANPTLAAEANLRLGQALLAAGRPAEALAPLQTAATAQPGASPAIFLTGRTLATLQPKPVTVGLGYTHGWLPDMEPEEHDVALDALLNDNGVVWPV